MDKQKENFERLVRSHKNTIYTVCYMLSKDEDEVADLFQETLINVWRGLPKYQGGDEALRGWIYRVALNTCISLDRNKRRRKTVPLTMDVNFFDPQGNERSEWTNFIGVSRVCNRLTEPSCCCGLKTSATTR